ncbi:hypothetical protein F4820DRAFT_310815 [Hypoxylon rubiginosum]|uniref:Uncharacterized protein n=1 Tax=Hypoxylon rubiginosum TaxID=110542 RepID=A0ACB9Z136_9PEZI|nr:hypothetical protein F4820DRAFT_310815 [Hypoxylon rubiginosum]
MVSYRMIAVAGFLASVSALPLNINLGAYSPALVVGDGEISFGGGQDVTNLMNALEGAAVNAASGTTNNAATENAAAVPAVSAETVPVDVVAAQAETPAAATPAETAQVDPNLQQQAQQISGLQGMGKEIAPRDSESPKAKRDLAGFDRALTFAEAALTKGPTIQLGTGEGGAGVGIIVDNNGGTVGEAAAAAAKVKRDESSQPRRRTKVTRMYVKRGVPAAIQTSSEFEARSVESLPVANIPAVAKRETVSSDVIDSINLNVNDDQGFTMTFVETTEDDDATTDELDE